MACNLRTGIAISIRSEASTTTSTPGAVSLHDDDDCAHATHATGATTPPADGLQKSEAPSPYPLPMPPYGGYFAAMHEYLPNDTNSLPNPPYQRCNLAIMLLTDLVVDCTDIDWTVHLPLILHIVFLGTSTFRPFFTSSSSVRRPSAHFSHRIPWSVHLPLILHIVFLGTSTFRKFFTSYSSVHPTAAQPTHRIPRYVDLPLILHIVFPGPSTCHSSCTSYSSVRPPATHPVSPGLFMCAMCCTGMDNPRPLIHEHCKKLLLNLLLVLSAHNDHFAVAKVILGNKNLDDDTALTLPTSKHTRDSVFMGNTPVGTI